ncbi:MAG: hypothetical protein RML56_12695 [Burkholderiales bacterium]|nr:hypothetical protein [Burkholderiales bacterium]
MEKIGDELVEERRLLQVDRMAASRQDREPGGGDAALHQEGRLETRFFLVACDDQHRHVDRLHFGGEVIERRSARLDAR